MNEIDEAVPQLKFYEEIKEYEKLDSEEERLCRSRQIYDGYIMKELLSCSHVRAPTTLHATQGPPACSWERLRVNPGQLKDTSPPPGSGSSQRKKQKAGQIFCRHTCSQKGEKSSSPQADPLRHDAFGLNLSPRKQWTMSRPIWLRSRCLPLSSRLCLGFVSDSSPLSFNSDKFTRFCQWKNVELNIHLTMNDFSVHRIIGRGGFGEVYGCRKADTGKM
ncbi:hypothetical protein JZ751_011673 [Albula glossodonta]|uniref:RGS domain-containing protein n=1 Tax=Albula glossodonta TaxID=121402 RepID=A0A8T2PQB9_9TELE|nr:hypothetical protein JZ751_011673 [Albula glossodonta]